MLLAAKVWHYWLAVPIVALVVVVMVATLVGYLNKVVRPEVPVAPGALSRRLPWHRRRLGAGRADGRPGRRARSRSRSPTTTPRSLRTSRS